MAHERYSQDPSPKVWTGHSPIAAKWKRDVPADVSGKKGSATYGSHEFLHHGRTSNLYLSTEKLFVLAPPPTAFGCDSKATISLSSRANTSKPSCAAPVSTSPTHFELVEFNEANISK